MALVSGRMSSSRRANIPMMSSNCSPALVLLLMVSSLLIMLNEFRLTALVGTPISVRQPRGWVIFTAISAAAEAPEHSKTNSGIAEWLPNTAARSSDRGSMAMSAPSSRALARRDSLGSRAIISLAPALRRCVSVSKPMGPAPITAARLPS